MSVLLRAAAASFGLVLATAPAFAEDLVFTLTNDSGFNLHEFYASPANTDEWGDDILGADLLETGMHGEVTIADGSDQCDYDLRMVFSDADTLEDTVNLCEMGSYTITAP